MNYEKITIGKIFVHRITFQQAIDAIIAKALSKEAAYVFTPNVDHVCLAQEHAGLESAYQGAFLSLADGMPLVWLSQALGKKLPEKISGSDLLEPLLSKAAKQGLKVYFLGGQPGIAKQAYEKLKKRIPDLLLVGLDAPPLDFEKNAVMQQQVLSKIQAVQPHLLIVALGCPKQELWIHQQSSKFGSCVALGVGATLDFLAGSKKRSPVWMQRCGLEWLYRFAQEPRRMFHRYFVRDWIFVVIASGMLWQSFFRKSK